MWCHPLLDFSVEYLKLNSYNEKNVNYLQNY